MIRQFNRCNIRIQSLSWKKFLPRFDKGRRNFWVRHIHLFGNEAVFDDFVDILLSLSEMGMLHSIDLLSLFGDGSQIRRDGILNVLNWLVGVFDHFLCSKVVQICE
jgi:hypothetical protein